MKLILSLLFVFAILVTVKPFGLLRFQKDLVESSKIKTKSLTEEPEQVPEVVKNEDMSPETIEEDVTQMGLGQGFEGGSSVVAGVGGGGSLGGAMAVVKPARVLRRVDPVYPEKAKNAQITGSVTLKIHLSESGEVLHCVVVSSEPAGVFDQSALQAVAKWTFEPAVKEGQKSASYLVQKVSFKMENL